MYHTEFSEGYFEHMIALLKKDTAGPSVPMCTVHF